MRRMRDSFLESLKRAGISPMFFAVAAIFLGVVVFFVPEKSAFQLDGDEGVILMTGMLIDQGYPLYDEIWSDHPPVLPTALSIGFHFFGYKVGLARLFVAFLSALLLGAVYQYLQDWFGRTTALVGTILVFLAPLYLILSVSVMNGLPSLALGMLSLMSVSLWHGRRAAWTLVASGVLLAFAVQTKLFSAILVPVIFLGLAAVETIRSKGDISWKTFRPVLLWSVSFLVPFLLILFLLVRPHNIPDLFLIHLGAGAVPEFDAETYRLGHYLKESYPLFILAVLGVADGLRKKQWIVLYAFAWLVLGFVFLLLISPVWDHHLLLITIPASILAAPFICSAGAWLVEETLGSADGPRPKQLQIAVIVLGIAGLFAFRPPDAFEHLALWTPGSGADLRVGVARERLLRDILEAAPESHWILTDNPMMAFRARIPMPPFTATFSLKRLLTGALTEADLIEVLQDYRPEQVLIDRFELPNLLAALGDDYVLKEEKEGDFVWFLRRDLAAP